MLARPFPVTFVLIDRAPLEQLGALSPDRDWREFIHGERAWVLQSYLRLRAGGYPVALSARFPREGIAVFSSKQRRLLCAQPRNGSQAVLVGIREDVAAAPIADFEVVQNRAQADAAHRFFIPLWPQPGLLARDPARQARIENLAFKGFSANLHPGFRDEHWRRSLATHGLVWSADAVPYVKNQASDKSALAWNDFREIDLIVAVRPPERAPYPRKPAAKLYNAWHAGVPALLGPEIAYRELRESALDYLEIETPGQALQAIADLRAEPQRYLAMIEQGRRRARQFTAEHITSLWAQLLYVRIPALADEPRVRRWRGRSLRAKSLVRRFFALAGS